MLTNLDIKLLQILVKIISQVVKRSEEQRLNADMLERETSVRSWFQSLQTSTQTSLP